MGMWTDYYRIIKPKPAKSEYVTDNYIGSSYNNWSWYSRMLRGSASRYALYQQYVNMDSDVDVSRALDTIAEEMTPDNAHTDLPFEIDYQNDDNKEVDEGITMTIRAALRHWCELQGFEGGKTFDIARQAVKYGDCFFKKKSDLKEWQWIPPQDVIGIAVDDDHEITHYHLRKGENKHGGFAEVDVVPKAGMVHFSLCSKMTEAGPFGDSVLRPTIKAYRQLTMLEDSVIIYRIVRAPERRVFFIDTGNMPPHKVKEYLTTLMTEVKQKRIPTVDGGTSQNNTIDSSYAPMSMVEDYFFAQTANGRGSRVETLAGGENLGEITDLNYFQMKFFRGLRIPTSYMSTAKDGGSQRQDGKVGLAYIEELRFANYIARLQNKLEPIFDDHFKAFLKSMGIKIDQNLFKISLPTPQNFADYKQAAVDNELISNFNNLKDVKSMAFRYAAKRYLRWTEDDIQTNEALYRQERNIPEGGIDPEKLSDLRMMYDPTWLEDVPKISGVEDINKIEVIGPDAPPPDEAGVPPPEGDAGAEGEPGAEGEGEPGAAPDETPAAGEEPDTGGEEPAAEKNPLAGVAKAAGPAKKKGGNPLAGL